MRDENVNITVSVIIVNYNTAHLTIDCIESILKSTTSVSFEVIMVDNASDDNSPDIINQVFPSVKVIRLEKNVGFGKANNIGASVAKGEFLFLLNSDTVLLNDALSIFTEIFQHDTQESIGIAGGNLFTKDLKPNHSYATFFPSLINIFFYRAQIGSLILSKDNFNTTGKIKSVAIIIGADMFMRRSLFLSVGGFDPAFFMYVEDGELCLRIKNIGLQNISVPTVEIIHYQGKSSTTEFKLITEISSYVHYFQKHGKRYQVTLYKCIETFFAIIKLTLFMFDNKKRKAYISLMRFLALKRH